jgi:hypothetical protein
MTLAQEQSVDMDSLSTNEPVKAVDSIRAQLARSRPAWLECRGQGSRGWICFCEAHQTATQSRDNCCYSAAFLAG